MRRLPENDDLIADALDELVIVTDQDQPDARPGEPAQGAGQVIDTGADGVNRASVHIWVDGVLAFDGGALPEITAAFAGPLAGATQTADTLRVVLHPVVPMASLATVSVRVAGQTVGGAASVDEVYSFVVEDRTAPRVVGAQAARASS